MEIPKLNNASIVLDEALKLTSHVFNLLKKLPKNERPEFMPHFLITSPSEHFYKKVPKESLKDKHALIMTNLSDVPLYGKGTEYQIAKMVINEIKPNEVAIITDNVLRNKETSVTKKITLINYQTQSNITLILFDQDTEKFDILIDNQSITKTTPYEYLNKFPFILLNTPNNIN